MILIFGDSITWGARDEKGGWAQRIKSFVQKKAYSEGVKEYPHIYNLGVSGDNSQKLLQRFEPETRARRDDQEKLQIIVAVGINDSYYYFSEDRYSVPPEEYKNNIQEIIKKSKNLGAEAVFVGLTPVDKRVDPVPWHPEVSFKMEFVKKYDDLLRETCEENNVSYIELMNKFEKKNTADLLADGLHPSTKGHDIIYNELLQFLQKKSFI